MTLHNYLFGSVELNKNAYPDKYKYSSYSTGFESCLEFSLTDGSNLCKNVTIFGVDMSLSVHSDNKNKDILSLGDGPTQG